MKQEDIIVKLIETSHGIYNLYKEIRKSIESGNAKKKDLDNIFSFIDFLIQKEKKYLNNLKELYYSELNEIYLTLRGSYAFYECKTLENYIECSDNAIPLLRTLEKINDLIDETYTPVPEIDEDDELLYKDALDITRNKTQKPQAGYSSVYEHIIDSIFPALEIETCVYFMNEAKKIEKEITDTELLEKIKQIPYDMTFLNSALEDLFIKDHILNPSHKLFDTGLLYEDCYEEEVLNKVLLEDIINQLKKQIKELANKRKTKTQKKAFLKSIYISFLYYLLSDDDKDDLLVELKDIIESITYPFEIINILKADANKIICHEIVEVINEEDEEQFQKVKKEL